MPLRELELEGREERGFAAYGGELGCLCLKAGTQFEEASHVVFGDLRDDETSFSRRLDEAFRGQSAKRFANRCAGDPKARGLFHL